MRSGANSDSSSAIQGATNKEGKVRELHQIPSHKEDYDRIGRKGLAIDLQAPEHIAYNLLVVVLCDV